MRFAAVLVGLAVALTVQAATPASEDPVSSIPVYEEPSIDRLIELKAQQYGVSSQVMHTVINCESGYNSNAVGDGGHSRGLVQIYRPAHPHITDEMAFDPVFAVDFLAKHLAAGNEHMWTCYRIHYG